MKLFSDDSAEIYQIGASQPRLEVQALEGDHIFDRAIDRD
jgi:hypothetical protein